MADQGMADQGTVHRGTSDEHARLYQAHDIPQAAEIARAAGFCLIKNFFDRAEVEGWEETSVASSSMHIESDFLSSSLFDSLLFHPRVLALAHALLGPELVYYGETNRMHDNTEPFREWHVDARGMPHDIMALHEPAPGHVFEGWRFAVYFRDYATASGGLKVAPGSHLRPKGTMKPSPARVVQYIVRDRVVTVDLPPFEIHNIPSVPGDLVIFNLRTFHAAGFARLVGHPDSPLPPNAEKMLLEADPTLLVPAATPRNGLFFDYGAPGIGLDLYIKWRVYHTFRGRHAAGPEASQFLEPDPNSYDKPLRRAVAERHGVTLRFDRIIGNLLYKRRANGGLDAADDQRLAALLATHREYSPHFPIRALASL